MIWFFAKKIYPSRPTRWPFSNFATRNSPFPVQIPTSSELAAVFVWKQTRIRQVLHQGKYYIIHSKWCTRTLVTVISFLFSSSSTSRTRIFSGDTWHTVRVATARDEILHHHWAAHRLHGRSISGERMNNTYRPCPRSISPLSLPHPPVIALYFAIYLHII